jgi:ATP-binding cassette subfamily C protein CydCD
MRPLDPRLLRHASAARRFVVLAAAVAVATAVLAMVQAQLLATGITRAFLGGAGLGELGTVLTGLAVVVAGRAALGWAGEVAAHRAAADVIHQLRTRLVAHVLALGARHRDLPPTGELATLSTRGLDGLEGYFSRYLPTLLVAAVVPALVTGRILFADWMAGAIIALTVPLIPIFMILVGLHTEKATGRQWRTLAVLGHHFLDVVAGLDTLVAFGRARPQAGRLRTLAEQYRTATMDTLRIAFLSALVLELLASLSVALVAVSVGLRLVEGRLDLATGLLVLVLAPEVYLPLRAVGARFHDSAEGLAAASAVFAVLELPVEGGLRCPAPDPSRVPPRIRDLGVTGRSGPVLENLDLDLAPGTLLGLTGPSGCGKSTLVDVLLGLRRPDSGQVLVGGVDLADIDRDAWLRRIAWVPQRPVLVAGTVADNIRLGRPEATTGEVHRAATLAALDVTPDTMVGERGAGMSTGQRRRVALARAVLADRPLLLLDEPTEGVDPDTEAAIVAALPVIRDDRTVVLVSHRRELLDACDRVLELPGRLVVAHGLQMPVAAASPARSAGEPAVEPVAASVVRPKAQPVVQPMAGGVVQRLGHPAVEIGPGRAGTAAVPSRILAPLRWTLSSAAPQRARLALALLLGSGALGCGVALTATSAWLISAAALQPPVLSLMVAIVAVRAFGLGKGVLRYAERLVSHDAALRCLCELRLRLWDALVRLGPAATARIRRGDLLSRLVGDVDAQQDVLVRAALPVGCAMVVGAGMSVGLGLLLPAAGVLAALGLLVAGIAAPAVAVLAAWSTERRAAAARAEVLTRTVEILEAAPDLVVFGAAARYRLGLLRADRRLSDLLRRGAMSRGLGTGLGTLAVGATSVALLALGIAALRAGTLPGPALAVLALTPLAAAELVAGLPDAALRLVAAGPAATRLAELERRPATVLEPAVPAGIAPPRALAARGLAVRWPGADHDAVRGVSLTLAPGTRLALTGPSGSGKSTVVAALLRQLDPVTGVVLADGRDTRELTGDEVRAGLGWCGPHTHLFDNTLRANLLLARPDADDTDLVDALVRARLGAWLAGLPDGLDTWVGKQGGAVSGGERQRIGVARTLLADRPVLLFDEPTAHLDQPTASALAAELLAATSGRTTLVVTHRPEQVPTLPELRLGAPETRPRPNVAESDTRLSAAGPEPRPSSRAD